MRTKNNLQYGRLTKVVYLNNAFISLITPLGVWLGGIRDYVLSVAFLALSFFWVLAFQQRNVAAARMSVYGIVCGGAAGVIVAVVYYRGNLLNLHRQSEWVLVAYLFYLLIALIFSTCYPFRHRFGYGGGRWLGWIHIVAIFLISYTIAVVSYIYQPL